MSQCRQKLTKPRFVGSDLMSMILGLVAVWVCSWAKPGESASWDTGPPVAMCAPCSPHWQNAWEAMNSLEGLDSIYPARRCVRDAAFQAAFESDGLTAFRAKPLAIVIPETTDEVIATVRWCHTNSVPFVARGSGTSLSGGSLPVADGIVIALNRLNKILTLDPARADRSGRAGRGQSTRQRCGSARTVCITRPILRVKVCARLAATSRSIRVAHIV